MLETNDLDKNTEGTLSKSVDVLLLGEMTGAFLSF